MKRRNFIGLAGTGGGLLTAFPDMLLAGDKSRFRQFRRLRFPPPNFVIRLVLSTFLLSACKTSRLNDPPVKQFMIGGTAVGIQYAATHLDVPWQIVWGPDNRIWYTELGGSVNRLDPHTGLTQRLLQLDDVFRHRGAGLLGMAVHPDLKEHPYIFLSYIRLHADTSRLLRVVRFTVDQDTLVDSLVITEYPAWKGHFGTRLNIAPDGKLMIATGDGALFDKAQHVGAPNGKILRFHIDGSIPSDNPIPGSPVWAWGLRNPQGLVYAGTKLYSSDHGDATDDEINLITKGANYGWPQVEGYADKKKEQDFVADSTVTYPLKSWTPTIAPAGMAYYPSDKIPELKGKLLLATLKGNSLRAIGLNGPGDSVISDENYFRQVFGRLRSVCVSPSGDVYVATSNRDWNPNGFAEVNDDRILRIYRLDNAHKDKDIPSAIVDYKGKDVVSQGELLYTDYCASCHQKFGKGIEGTIPPLNRAPIVAALKPDSLLSVVLSGRNEMPAFDFLSDRDLAVILSYVRKRFGPQADAVNEKDVRHIRKTD